MSSTVILGNNVKIAAAPPVYYIPDSNGTSVPTGCTQVRFVLGPASSLVGDTFSFAGEATLDGVTWVEMWSNTFGPIPTNPPVSSVEITDELGEIDSGGNILNYPVAWRLRVDAAPSVRIPSITVTFS